MRKINLRGINPAYYTKAQDAETPNEVTAGFSDDKVKESSRQRILRRYKANYSLDAGDGIENHALFPGRSPEEKVLDDEEREQLYAAVAALPDKQSIRVCQYYFLDMSMTEIARIEGVSVNSISVSIKRGLRDMKKYF